MFYEFEVIELNNFIKITHIIITPKHRHNMQFNFYILCLPFPEKRQILLIQYLFIFPVSEPAEYVCVPRQGITKGP